MSSISSSPPTGPHSPEQSGLPDFSGVDATASSPDAPTRDVMAPWGEEGPPGTSWRTDVLGEGFESRTIELIDDAEGPYEISVF